MILTLPIMRPYPLNPQCLEAIQSLSQSIRGKQIINTTNNKGVVQSVKIPFQFESRETKQCPQDNIQRTNLQHSILQRTTVCICVLTSRHRVLHEKHQQNMPYSIAGNSFLLKGTTCTHEDMADPLIQQGLRNIHAKGVCHYDMKPFNVIKTPSGSKVFIDFGASDINCDSDKLAKEMELLQSRYFCASLHTECRSDLNFTELRYKRKERIV